MQVVSRAGRLMGDSRMADLERLYQEYGPSLMRFLRGRHGADEAEDLLHETFVAALRRLDRLKAATSPRAWLFAIARNLSLTVYRRRRPTTAIEADLPATAEPRADPRLDDMRQAIAELPEQQRQALELRLREELSYEEIAAVLDIPLGTVRSRLHHAVRRLRQTLTE